MWFEKLNNGVDVLLAGLAGAFVGLILYTEIRTVKQKIYFTLCGGLSSYYVAPWLAEYFSLTSENSRLFFGFMLGVFGASVLQAIKRGLDAADFWELVKARFNFGRNNP